MPEGLRCEIAVVGAGPAGIAAAVRAGEAGRRVVLIDENPRPGGQIWRHRERFEAPAVAGWWMARLERTPCEALYGASVVDGSAGELVVEQGARTLRVAAEQLVLATGARELFLPFPGWTLPNVLGVGAMQSLLKSGLEVRGRKVVVAGSGPLLLAVAAAVRKAGGRLLLVAEQAERARLRRFARGLWRHPGKLAQAARYRAAFIGTPYRAGAWVSEAEGDERLRRVTVTDGGSSWSGVCDLLCAGYGLVPNVELASLLGCAVAQGRVVVVDGTQRTSLAGVYCAGEPTGVGGVELAVVEGEIAGLSAAGEVGALARLQRRRRRLARFARRLETAFDLRDELRALPTGDTIVCRCEDVPWGRIDPGWSARQARLAVRLGMGPCQGRVCGPAMRFLRGWQVEAVRPPIEPARIGTLAGEG